MEDIVSPTIGTEILWQPAAVRQLRKKQVKYWAGGYEVLTLL